ncbi:MAG TPA: hypothetical protein VG820_01450 [Fimbriimonadaceae bacterium]|nr:hypothetical protein [Fimbriimonadaceae bacterium]
MSRFEQRRDFGPREMLAARGVKFNKNNAIVHLENTGNQSDLLRQQNLYWKEGYDTFHSDESGVYMELPRAEVEANMRRYQRDAEERLVRPPAAGLDKEYREEGNTAGYEKSMTAQDFLETDVEG